MDRFRTFPRFSISLVLNYLFEILQIPIDPTRDSTAKARGQFQGNARALVRMRRERNDTRGEVVASVVVGNSSPGKPSLRDAQHHLKHRLILLSVESE